MSAVECKDDQGRSLYYLLYCNICNHAGVISKRTDGSYLCNKCGIRFDDDNYGKYTYTEYLHDENGKYKAVRNWNHLLKKFE